MGAVGGRPTAGTPRSPARGEIWWVDFDPMMGHEQAGRRPALVVSANAFNQGPWGLVWVLPLTRIRRPYPFHVEVQPAEAGLSVPCSIMCDQLRSISVGRLLDSAPAGRIWPATMAQVEDVLKVLLDLP